MGKVGRVGLGQNQFVPFLSGELVTCELDSPDLAELKSESVAAWLKDDHAAFLLGELEVELTLNRNPDKRLSRLFRPYIWGATDVSTTVVEIQGDRTVADGQFTIGIGALKHIAKLQKLSAIETKKLLRAKRVELTFQSDKGQLKGHAHVLGSGNTITMIGDQWKKELKTNRSFLGVQPIRAKKGVWTDVQSWINLHRFLNPHLKAWIETLMQELVQQVKAGGNLSKMAFGIETPDDIEKVESFPIAYAIAAGANPMWFERMLKTILKNTVTEPVWAKSLSQRVYLPHGYKLYIASDAYTEPVITAGYGKIDYESATLWVNREDYAQWIGRRLGGCDSDDMVWVLPFTEAHTNKQKLLAWRSPNQFGEYILLDTEIGEENLPVMDSTLLPPVIEAQTISYGQLPKPDQSELSFEKRAEKILENKGVLGRYINLLMAYTSMNWAVPSQLPARLEDVIDASVKTFAPLDPVKDWCDQFYKSQKAKPIPYSLRERNTNCKPEATQFDEILSHQREQIAWAEVEVEKLYPGCMPPAVLFENLDPENFGIGYTAWRAYNRKAHFVLEQYNFELEMNPEAELNWQPCIDAFNAEIQKATNLKEAVRSALVAPYIFQEKDGKRIEGAAWVCAGEICVEILKDYDLIGSLEWIADRPIMVYPAEKADETQAKVTRVAAPWFNLYKAETGFEGTMGEIDPALRQSYKEKVASTLPTNSSIRLEDGWCVLQWEVPAKCPVKKGWEAPAGEFLIVDITPFEEDYIVIFRET